MKEQIEFITNYARTCLMMAKILEKVNPGSSRAYAIQGRDCCLMALKLQAEWDADMTREYKMAA